MPCAWTISLAPTPEVARRGHHRPDRLAADGVRSVEHDEPRADRDRRAHGGVHRPDVGVEPRAGVLDVEDDRLDAGGTEQSTSSWPRWRRRRRRPSARCAGRCGCPRSRRPGRCRGSRARARRPRRCRRRPTRASRRRWSAGWRRMPVGLVMTPTFCPRERRPAGRCGVLGAGRDRVARGSCWRTPSRPACGRSGTRRRSRGSRTALSGAGGERLPAVEVGHRGARRSRWCRPCLSR